MKQVNVCPECGGSWVVLSGNWAGCRDQKCGWQGRVRDVEVKEVEEYTSFEKIVEALIKKANA